MPRHTCKVGCLRFRTTVARVYGQRSLVRRKYAAEKSALARCQHKAELARGRGPAREHLQVGRERRAVCAPAGRMLERCKQEGRSARVCAVAERVQHALHVLVRLAVDMVVAGLPDSGPAAEHDAPRPWRDEIVNKWGLEAARQVLGDLHRHHPIPAPLPRESRQPVPQVGEAHEPARRLLHVFSAIDPEPRDGRRILPQPASVCTRAASQVQQVTVASEIAARIGGSQGGVEACRLLCAMAMLCLFLLMLVGKQKPPSAFARQRPGQLSPCIGTLALAQQRDGQISLAVLLALMRTSIPSG